MPGEWHDERSLRALRSIPAFAGCSVDDLAAVARFTTHRTARAQQMLYWQDELCGAVYVLLEGAVKLVRQNGRRREKVIRMLAPGEMFGEVALFSNRGYPTGAVAVGDSELLAIEAVPFARQVYTSRECAWSMLVWLARRVGHLMTEVERLSFYNAEQRVAAHLLDGDNGEGRAGLAGGAARGEGASFLGITPETLCRLLTRFQRRGLVSIRDGAVEVRDPKGLSDLLP